VKEKASNESERNRRQSAHWSELLRPAEVLIYILIAVAVVELYTRASYLITHLFSVLLLFVFGAIIALLLTPVVDAMETVVVFRKRRGLAAIEEAR
jgi:predicted PurR-regulated permease PerM